MYQKIGLTAVNTQKSNENVNKVRSFVPKLVPLVTMSL